MHTLINTKLQERRCKPAIWVEGHRLAVGFKPHEKYNLVISKDNRTVQFIRDINGEHTVSVRTSRCSKKLKLPLIELREDDLLDVFEIGMKLRIVVKDGLLTVSIHGKETAMTERVKRVLERTQSGQPLEIGSFFTGGGVLDRALHDGMKSVGLNSYLKVAIESEERYVEALMKNQADLFRKDSIILNSLIEDVEMRKDFTLDIVCLGLPCTGASKAGKSKNKIHKAEEHATAGAAFFYALSIIKAANPFMVVLENVPDYESEMSYKVIQSVLDNFGYEIKDTTLNGNVFGCLENRNRLCAVAVTKGLPVSFSFTEMVKPLRRKEINLSEHILDVPLDSTEWRSYDYLKTKESRDKAAGKGFKRALYDGTEPSISTIRRLYHKGGSCDQYLVHPENSALTRKFRATEHAAFKAIPQYIIEGVSETTAHEICGQSVTFWAFVSVGVGVGLHTRLNANVIDDFKFVEKGEQTDVNVVKRTSFDLLDVIQIRSQTNTQLAA